MKIRIQNNKVISIIVLCILFIYMTIYRFIILNNFLKYEEFITSSFFIIMTVLTIWVLGFRKNKVERVNDSKLLILIAILLLYFSLIYCIGFFKGFLQNSYSLNLKHVFYNILCPCINLICLEIIRYVLMWSNRKNKSFYIVCVIAFTLLELLFSFDFYNIDTIDGIFELIGLIILRNIVDNLLLCFMTINVGLKACIIYKLFTVLYVYLVPIIPDLGLFIETIIDVLLPFILWLWMIKIVDIENGFKKEKEQKDNVLNNLIFISMIIILILVLGITPIKVKTIASPSMSPTIEVGDAVIINSMIDKNKLKEGNIIAFKHDGKIIVHRIDKILDDGKYITKGDYNNDIDHFTIDNDDIVGKLIINIPYIGYPAIYINELIGGY